LLPDGSSNEVLGFGLEHFGRTASDGVDGIQQFAAACLALLSAEAQLFG